MNTSINTVKKLILVATILSASCSFGNTATAAPAKIRNQEVTVLDKARALFEKGQYAQAVQVYESISKNSKFYLESREELAWAYLQTENWSSLRGILVHINSPLTPQELRFEGRVLSAISDLHTCDFAQVKNEITKFQSEMGPFVIQIEKQLKMTGKSRQAVTDKIKLRNKETLIREAITKMRFVKSEYLNQLYLLEKFKTRNDVLAKTGDAKGSEMAFDSNSLNKLEKSKMVFKAEGDFWQDEVFNLKSMTSSECDDFQGRPKKEAQL